MVAEFCKFDLDCSARQVLESGRVFALDYFWDTHTERGEGMNIHKSNRNAYIALREESDSVPYNAKTIANWFVDRAHAEGKTLSIMTLLKLTYIAHGWHLEVRKSPLFTNRIEAWQYGPVIPEVYNAFRPQGVNVVRTVPVVDNPIAPDVNQLLGEIWGIYGHLSGFQLSEITHEPGGPWEIATRKGGNYARILDSVIQQHYEDKRRKANEGANV